MARQDTPTKQSDNGCNRRMALQSLLEQQRRVQRHLSVPDSPGLSGLLSALSGSVQDGTPVS
ncbi:hypothetical protein GCM10027091_20390 [Streptomyces daliensis]